MTNALNTAAVNLRLELLGLPAPADTTDTYETQLVDPIIARQRELDRRLSHRLPAADARIQAFLDSYLQGTGSNPQLPRETFVLDQPGLARAISLPYDGDTFTSEHLTSYRILNGVLHNPANDRRTTKGVFHIADGGLPVQDDKIEVPRAVFGRLLEHAFQPPEDAMTLPYSAKEDKPVGCWVSLLLRPIVVPEVPGFSKQRTMETRFIAPGTLVANLDFVEGIFGNGGDPYVPEYDASLNPETWTGHTGLVVLAPHLTKLTKKELGLPHYDEATERQRRDGQCWKDPQELYNNGGAFKCCARDERGVITTVIADNYFGYCKKEVKAQISYSANLLGLVEEEHSGGARVYPQYNLGQHYIEKYGDPSYSLEEIVRRDPQRFVLQPGGYGLDLENDQNILVPSGATFSLRTATVEWTNPDGSTQTIPLHDGVKYVCPDGYQISMLQIAENPALWTLIGTAPTSTTYHKPATVSGGGKSEVSKAIQDAIINGDAFAPDFDADMAKVDEILHHNYQERFLDPVNRNENSRSVLSDRRSIGSVIKLLTPSSDYTDEYNEWLDSIPDYIKELTFIVKRFYQPEWGEDWLSHFTTGVVNGRKGTSLRLDGDKIRTSMLRVGYEPDGSWRLFGLRHDFYPAAKVQTEDDITASEVVPVGGGEELSRKYVRNCEQLLFQRPDEAIHRGYDKQAERDMATPGTFLSNYEPLDRAQAVKLVEDAVRFSQYTKPMQDILRRAAYGPEDQAGYVVSSAHPRLVAGVPTKNPRYLQTRPDLAHPEATASADLGSRINARISMDEPFEQPVDVIAAGRRNNPADEGVPPLACYAPLHYMELPELFMEFISSMTGKSPSTTGAGSEGAMTKGPFNALPSIIDLNAALLSFALTGYDGWLSSAGFVGPHVQVDHDVSMLIPEAFCRMKDRELNAKNLIAEGSLEPVEDVVIDGAKVEASRLGYRMTEKFATKYFGRIFLHPHLVFTQEMLRPELQDQAVYAESIATILETHRRVAESYITDGTIALGIPPIKGLLEIMANGQTSEGYTLQDEGFRNQFERESILASDWYKERLESEREASIGFAERELASLDDFLSREGDTAARRALMEGRKSKVVANLTHLRNAPLSELNGTLGRQARWNAEV
ncbi:hypothetical protein [Ancrocorticia populi]|uniref:hypothetical protein n=1 Tax=Ancrocorticia populi TaxID=2175228 RepID=UPI001057ECD5|nr:hypothetical protein [Ancrocorticia populi]